jgi:hypothetical protein
MEEIFERLLAETGHAETVLMLVVLLLSLLVFVLSAIAIPGLIPAHAHAHRAVCINNLGLIENAKAKWAKAAVRRRNDIPSEEDLFGLDLKQRPVVLGVAFTLSELVGEKPKCSSNARGHKID